VFSLPKESLPSPRRSSSNPQTVGLGLINYYGWQHDPGIGEQVYQTYFSKIKGFASWLFRKGFAVRIIFGDRTDHRPVQEFIEFVNEEGESGWRERFFVEELTTFNELFNQIAQTDLVVSSRFHNVLCSLMLEKPVISLGYHEKNANLMTAMGLEKYCQHIEQFTLEKLMEQVECYTSDMQQSIQQIRNKNEQYRPLLDEQYRYVLLENKDAG
jgi:polysaccharide pyruvyl transferase WcaK-like protein